jgi:hypothetical protein
MLDKAGITVAIKLVCRDPPHRQLVPGGWGIQGELESLFLRYLAPQSEKLLLRMPAFLLTISPLAKESQLSK